jgi:hypothetical protein
MSAIPEYKRHAVVASAAALIINGSDWTFRPRDVAPGSINLRTAEKPEYVLA